jgi:hypothetical protein
MKPSNLQQNTNPENDDDKIIGNYFSSLNKENYSDTFPAVENWIRIKTNQFNIKKNTGETAPGERSFIRMKKYILAHKIKLVYTIIALAIITGACSIPVTQNETIGHVLSWTLPAGTSQDQLNNIQWIDKSKLSMSENTNNGKTEYIYTLMLPGSTEQQIQNYQKDLEKIKDITSIKVFPLNENVKRPVYSAALHSFFRINIDATKMNDEELTKEVERQLKEQGMENVSLNIKTDANGKRQVQMKVEHNNDNNPKDMELRINDGNSQEVMKFVKKPLDQEKLKNKTDDEIRKYVKEDLGNPDLKDDDIKITRENGEVNVKIEVKREENK